jgi:CRP-like cAMP-binding protein
MSFYKKYGENLNKNFFFRDMNFNETNEFLEKYKWEIKKYDKGEIAFDEEVFLKELNIVLDGTIKISKLTENGKEILYDITEKGKCFGLAGIYTNIRMEGLQFEALEKTTVFNIKNSEFHKIISKNKFFFEKYMEFQEYRLHFFVSRFENSFINCPYEKLLYFFNFLKEWNTNVIIMQKIQLAGYLNIGRASLYRELNKLKDDGFIDIIENKIYIK